MPATRHMSSTAAIAPTPAITPMPAMPMTTMTTITTTRTTSFSSTTTTTTTTTPDLPLEIWFQILNQTLNLLLPLATTPRLYSTYILPLLLTSHTFHEHCHPITFPYLRKHRLLQLFTRWKAAHSREVHFYHHPLRNHVRYALPDRVGNPPGEEYETLYSFIKRAYLFGCESVCGTVIPVEGGLETPVLAPSAPAAAVQGAPAAVAGGAAQQQQQQNAPGAQGENQGEAANATAAGTANNNSTPASATGTGANAGNIVVAPPAQATAPVVTHHGGDGGGQGWKNHALQWHVANPTFAAEGTIELYRDVVEEYRRVVCGSAAARERSRELERVMDMMKNPQRYLDAGSSANAAAASAQSPSEAEQMGEIEEVQPEDVSDDSIVRETNGDEEEEMVEQDENEMLSEIESKGGLRRRDSGHGQSSSEMDIDEDEDINEEDEEEDDSYEFEDPRHIAEHAGAQSPAQHQQQSASDIDDGMMAGIEAGVSRTANKREPESMAMDYQLESSNRHRRGLRSRKLEERSIPSSSSSSSPSSSSSSSSSSSPSSSSSSSSSTVLEESEREQERLIMDMALDKPFHQTLGGHFSQFHPFGPKTALLPTSLSSSLASSSASGVMGPTRAGSPAPFTPFTKAASLPSNRKSRESAVSGVRLSPSSSASSSSKPTRRNGLQRSNSSPGTRLPTTRAAQLGHVHSFDNAAVPTPMNTTAIRSPLPQSSTPSPALNSSSTLSTSPSTEQQQQRLCSNTLPVATPSSLIVAQQQPRPVKAEDLDFDLASACANTFASDLAFVLARVPGLGAHFHRFEQLAKLKLHVGWAKHAQSRGGNDVFVMSCSRLISLLAPLANTPLVSERGG